MSRYKFDRSREFIPGYKVEGEHWRSVVVQIVSEPEICQGAKFKLRADARVRVQEPLQICLECRSKSKKCDKQLTHIVRVRFSCNLFFCSKNCVRFIMAQSIISTNNYFLVSFLIAFIVRISVESDLILVTSPLQLVK